MREEMAMVVAMQEVVEEEEGELEEGGREAIEVRGARNREVKGR